MTRTEIELIEARQELATLKREIAEALKLDHDDWQRSKSREMDLDTGEAYRCMAGRTFKALKRLGIEFQSAE